MNLQHNQKEVIIIKIYIDFDGTLFNSSKLYYKFIDIFTKQNLKKEELKIIINKTYKDTKNFDIVAEFLINKYNLNSNILEKVNKLYAEDLVFKDVIPFLEKYYQKYDLILLTLGSKKYQKKKINSSNLSKYFKDIIITNSDKSKLNIDYTKGIFIDNNPLELKKFYNSKANYLIRIKRDTDKYSKINLDLDIPEFTNFEKLSKSNYIEKIGEINYE